MKYRFFFAFLVLIPLCWPTLGHSVDFVSVRGKELIGPKGERFLMKGVNLGNWLVPEGYMFRLIPDSARLIDEAIAELLGREKASQFWKKYLDTYVTEADIRYLGSIGVNSIRIPFNYKLFTNETYLGDSGPDRGFAIFDRVIGWCKKYGLYVVLDMHAAPGGQTGDNIDDGWGYPFLFENEAEQQRTAEIWAAIAKRYRDEPAVLGYDVLNEPIAHYFDVDSLNPKLEPLYRRIDKAIREVDMNHIIFLGGSQWDANFSVFGPPFDRNLVYTFHRYWMNPVQTEIQQYLDFRDRYNVPIYLGESGENTEEWIKQFRQLLDAQAIGWHFWPYKRMKAIQSRIEGASESSLMQIKTPDNYDQIEQYAASSRTSFGDMRKARPKDMAKVEKAFEDMLTNIRFENCVEKAGYRKALGF